MLLPTVHTRMYICVCVCVRAIGMSHLGNIKFNTSMRKALKLLRANVYEGKMLLTSLAGGGENRVN